MTRKERLRRILAGVFCFSLVFTIAFTWGYVKLAVPDRLNLVVSEEEIFSNAFAKTADRIMTVTQSPVVPVAVCIAAVIVIALLVFSLQKRREAKERQRQADEKMWSTPLESFGADEAAERAKKYENTDTHTQ